ncbi:unnamed protein product, partial [Notodromas monacha]
ASRSGVKTTCVCPYYVATGMFDGVRSKILPILQPEYVIKEVVNAMLTDQEMIVLPRIGNFLIFLKAAFDGKRSNFSEVEWLHLVVALPAARASTRLLVLGAVSLGTYLWVVTVVRGLRWALRAKRICVWVLSRFLPVKGYDKTHEIMRVDATMTNFKGRDPTESTATKPRVSVTTATTTTATSSPLHHLLDKSTAAAATAKLRCAVVAANNAKLDDRNFLLAPSTMTKEDGVQQFWCKHDHILKGIMQHVTMSVSTPLLLV